MTERGFKVPYMGDTPKSNRNGIHCYNSAPRVHSDSEESSGSTTESASSGAALSILAEHDDLIRLIRAQLDEYDYEARSYMDFVEEATAMYYCFKKSREQSLRSQERLDQLSKDQTELEHKLLVARKLLDHEKKNTRKAERERDNLELQIVHIKELLLKGKDDPKIIPEETLKKLPFLRDNNFNHYDDGIPNLSAIPEVNSTGSILSDFSYSRSEDDLDLSKVQGVTWKKHRPSTGEVPEPAYKKRRSSLNKVVEISNADTVRATTTLTMRKDGPITATSVIESVPKPSAPPESKSSEEYIRPTVPPANLIFQSWARDSPTKQERNNNCRQHTLQAKTIVIPDNCGPCEKRIRFGKTALKCKECKSVCHVECKDRLALPCVPTVNTPNQRTTLGVIGDYTPTTPPMVPSIIVHCVNEIEHKGLEEIGLYRVPGAERDVKSLKERFLKGKGVPSLSSIDIHVICGTVKDFLRSLLEPLVTFGLWKTFARALECTDKQDVAPILYEAISRLPQPNRDTLAYMMLHLQRISEAKECKMPVENLAKVFGPTIVGYSSEHPDKNNLMSETRTQVSIMEHLIRLPTSFWESFVNVDIHVIHTKMQQTPSTDSLLLRNTSRTGYTPNRVTPRRKRFFPSPVQN